MSYRIRVFGLLFAAVAGMIPLYGQTAAGCAVFPANNVWNAPVDKLPVHPNSATYIATIGNSLFLHPDFSANGGGIPFVVVPGTQPKVPIIFGEGATESDPGPYPVPPNAPIEGGPNDPGDRHVLVLERTNCILYEMYRSFPQPDGSWTAGSGAIFDLKSNHLRPAGWTSSDAAGLPIFPGLVRYEEVVAGVINHAIRMSIPRTRNQYIWPARHRASTLSGTQYVPMGQRFRLKADFNISPFPADVQVILTALKKYGAIIADNGGAWYMTGVPDSRWNDTTLHELHKVLASNLEAVDESSLMVDPDSAEIRLQPAELSSVRLTPASVTGGTAVTGEVTLSSPAPTVGVVVSLNSSNMAAASLPATVLVPAGATTASFPITTGAVSVSTPVTITASYLGTPKTAVLSVNPLAISSVAISPPSITGGIGASGTVTLTGPAPAAGATVLLTSSNTLAATVPGSIAIAGGARSATFSVGTLPQTTTAQVQITAAYNGSSVYGTLSIQPSALQPGVSALVITPATIQGGTTAGGYIYLTAAAPSGGVALSVTSSNPSLVLTPAAGWTVQAGNSLKYLTITAPPVTSTTTATITASANGVQKSAVLTINPATLKGLSFSPSPVRGGSTVTATILLGGTAAANTAISVTSSSPAIAVVPASVTLPAGSRTTTFSIRTGAVTATSSVIITLRQGTATIWARLTIQP